MKSIAFVVLCFLCTLAQVTYAEQGGEYDNTQCNGVGNVNSYCDGTEGPTEPPVCEETPPTVHNHVCIVPVQAVTSYLDLVSQFNFNPDPSVCEKQCHTLAKTCANVATAQSLCYANVIKGARTAFLYNCRTADPVVTKQCQAQVRTNSGINLDVFAANGLQARALCLDSVEACVAACQE